MNEAELRTLVRDRRLVTPELHDPNDYYGHATLLKAYTGLAQGRPLKAVIEHGPPLAGRWIWEADLNSRLPVVLCATARRAAEFAHELPATRKAIPIGPNLAYAPGGLRPNAEPADRRLVVFPVHSTHHFIADFEIELFADAVEREAADFDSVEVCLGWRDILRGHAPHYLDRGWACSTAGHMYDVQFLPRFKEIVSRAAGVVTNGMGTHLLFAVLLDRPAWLVDEAARDPRVEAPADRPGFDPEVFRTFSSAFDRRVDAVTPDQRDLVAEFTGIEHIRQPQELRAILHEAAVRYRELVPVARRLVARTRRRWYRRRDQLRRWSV